eukprot:3243022-Rhodomonas_salina.1
MPRHTSNTASRSLWFWKSMVCSWARATLVNASAGHSENQSREQQLRRLGYMRSRDRKRSLPGLMHRTQ